MSDQYKVLEKKLIEIEEELIEAKKKAEEYLNGWKRAKADYINQEKEIEKEKTEWVKFANITLVMQLLPILDNFKKAFAYLPKDLSQNNNTDIKHIGARPSGSRTIPQKTVAAPILSERPKAQEVEIWIEGIRQIKNQLENLLKNLGIEKIKTVGEKFDPALHESVGAEKSDKEDNLILKEITSGYKLHNQVIKPAKVIVNIKLVKI